ASGLPEEKVRLCPLGVDVALYSRPAPPLPLRRPSGEPISQYRVRFLNVSELNPRKNLLGLLRAWLKATSRQDDALLLLKLGCYAPDSLKLLREQLDRLQTELGKSVDNA